jgi:probable rRNA maturation factor
LKINLSLQQDFQAPELVLKRAQIKKIIETTLRHIGYKEDCEIGIACVDEESHQLNLQYREKDKPTNVCLFQVIFLKKFYQCWMHYLWVIW